MKKWEYLCTYYNPGMDVCILNELGDQGFELIQILQTEDRKNPRWIFKREKIEEVLPDNGD